MTAPWNAARAASRRPLRKPIVFAKPVGKSTLQLICELRDSGVDINTLTFASAEVAPYCTACRYNICCCVARQVSITIPEQPSAAPAPFAVGDRVWHIGTGPAEVAVVVRAANVGDIGDTWVSWGEGDERLHSNVYLRRAGDTDWLRALPPGTMVKLQSWPHKCAVDAHEAMDAPGSYTHWEIAS